MKSVGSVPLIRVEHLSKTYPTAGLLKRPTDPPPALHDVSFDIGPGETAEILNHARHPHTQTLAQPTRWARGARV